MARPRKIVDPTKLRNLALIGLSNEKIAQAVGISRDTLARRYRAVIEEGRSDGETRILAKIFQSALAGNVRCLELSAINRCGWVLKPEVAINVVQNGIAVDTRSPAEVKAHLVELQRAVWEETRRYEQNPQEAAPPLLSSSSS